MYTYFINIFNNNNITYLIFRICNLHTIYCVAILII